jgi:hypothetical protein
MESDGMSQFKVWGNENIMDNNKLVEYLISKHGYNKEEAIKCMRLADSKKGVAEFLENKKYARKIFKLY